MVVDPNTLVNTILPAPPAACPTAAAAVLPPAAMTPAYIQSHNPVSSIQYTQGCPIPIQSGQILTTVPVSCMVPGSPTINSSTSGASPVDNYTLSIYPNGFFSQNIYPYAYVALKNGIQSQLLSSVPSTFLSCDPKLVPNSQTASTSSSLVQCNPGSTYKYATISTPSHVPCTSRMVSGAPVYPMHLPPIVPTASLEMHPIPTPQIINNMDMFRATPPPTLPPATSTWKQS
ncbi:hypothetical protein TNCT_368051 [Trichonephila clavata]|uniref:Uncharacterized protein n=1 Tax=Trichonephila clavata TaxID=2740835 RepID=A0A8X6IR36_TRICU|nr:hypothetical protein TNCT_368051 [Trichonephila clavata]